jgi:hypothetical protein
MRFLGALLTTLVVVVLLDVGCIALIHHYDLLGRILSFLGEFILGLVCLVAFDRR